MSLTPSQIFLPNGGTGEFKQLAERIRQASQPESMTKIVPIAYVEWLNTPATHLALEALDLQGCFRPLIHVPMIAFDDPYPSPLATVFRLSWKGPPFGSGL